MTEDQFEKLAQLIQVSHDDLEQKMEEGFARVDARFEQIDARFGQVDARFDRMDNELAHIRTELKDIRKRLDVLEEKVDQQSGFAKEIDHILARVTMIEKHLGIAQPVS